MPQGQQGNLGPKCHSSRKYAYLLGTIPIYSELFGINLNHLELTSTVHNHADVSDYSQVLICLDVCLCVCLFLFDLHRHRRPNTSNGIWPVVWWQSFFIPHLIHVSDLLQTPIWIRCFSQTQSIPTNALSNLPMCKCLSQRASCLMSLMIPFIFLSCSCMCLRCSFNDPSFSQVFPSFPKVFCLVII